MSSNPDTGSGSLRLQPLEVRYHYLKELDCGCRSGFSP